MINVVSDIKIGDFVTLSSSYNIAREEIYLKIGEEVFVSFSSLISIVKDLKQTPVTENIIDKFLCTYTLKNNSNMSLNYLKNREYCNKYHNNKYYIYIGFYNTFEIKDRVRLFSYVIDDGSKLIFSNNNLIIKDKNFEIKINDFYHIVNDQDALAVIPDDLDKSHILYFIKKLKNGDTKY